MPRRWHQVGGAIRRRRWQQSPVTGKSTKETVKTIARGMPGEAGVTVVTMLVCFFILHARLRARRAPGIPCALMLFWGERFMHRSGASRREMAEVCAISTAVIASEAKQSIFDLAMPSRGLLRSARNDGSGAQKYRGSSSLPRLRGEGGTS